MSRRSRGKGKSEEQSAMDAFFANHGKGTDALLRAHGVSRFVDVIARVNFFQGPTPWVESEGGEDDELAAILSDEDAESDGALLKILKIDDVTPDLAPLRAKVKEAEAKVLEAKEKAHELEQSWSAQWEDKASAKMALGDAERKLRVSERELEESK